MEIAFDRNLFSSPHHHGDIAVVYSGKPDAALGSPEDRRFDEGVRMGSWGMLLHSATGETRNLLPPPRSNANTRHFSSAAAIFAVAVQGHVAAAVGTKFTYVFGLVSFAVCMMLTVAVPNVAVLNACAALSGIGFSVITTIPNQVHTSISL